jgi:putative DNA primase/helicase
MPATSPANSPARKTARDRIIQGVKQALESGDTNPGAVVFKATDGIAGVDLDFMQAIQLAQHTFDTLRAAAKASGEAEWQLTRFSTRKAVPIRWLWPGYLAEGKLTMLNGEPGHGKSLVTIDIAARITTAKQWPDGTPNELPPSDVLLMTEEEDADDTILPRFQTAGGDPKRLASLTINNGDGTFSIEKDADRLEKLIKGGAFKLIILDPVIDYTRAKQNMDEEVRPVLNRLVKLARETNVAVLGVNHLNKKVDLSAVHRVAGARAWVSVARLNFLLGKGDDSNGLRHICPLKMNVAADSGASLDYKIESERLDIPDDRDGIHISVATSQPRVMWQGKGTATIETITKAQMTSKEELPAVEWLRDYLSDGQWHPTKRTHEDAQKDVGISPATLKRAKDKLGVESRLVGMPAKGEWRLPVSSPAVPVGSLPSERVSGEPAS